MLTTTHVAINGALSRLAGSGRTGDVATLARRLAPDLPTRRALVAGGLAPDVGLGLLSLAAAVWYPAVDGWTLEETFRHVFGDLFYEHPLWISAHNLLHAPLVLAPLAAVGRRAGRRGAAWGPPLLAFAVGCLLHTALDVPTHVDDGPLLLFPFDLESRFHSPVSYWDPDHLGDLVRPVDLAISVLGGGTLLVGWWRDRRRGSDDLDAWSGDGPQPARRD